MNMLALGCVYIALIARITRAARNELERCGRIVRM